MDLKVERAKRRMTQDDLAKLASISRMSIVKIEKQGIDTIQVYILKKIAVALNTTVQELFFSEETA